VKSNSSKENKSVEHNNARIRYVMDKLSQLLVQLLGAYRNISLDNFGRTNLLQCKAITFISHLCKHFRAFPDTILNCVRVIAKLSLMETFRNQLGSQGGMYTKYLVL